VARIISIVPSEFKHGASLQRLKETEIGFENDGPEAPRHLKSRHYVQVPFFPGLRRALYA